MQESKTQKDEWSKPVKQLINYINRKIWVNDFDKLQLQTIQIQLNQSNAEISRLSIVTRMNDQEALNQTISYIYQNLKKVRSINHSLQSIFISCNRAETKSSPQNIINMDNQEKLQNQILYLYRHIENSVANIAFLNLSIQDTIKLIKLLPKEEELSKKYSIYRLFDMFKFEFNCLKNEIKTHASDQIQPEIIKMLQEIEEDKIMQWIYKAIDNELKIKTSLQNFQQILEKFLSKEFYLQQLKSLYINLDDASDSGSKETHLTSSDRKHSFVTSFTSISPPSNIQDKENQSQDTNTQKRKTVDYHNKLSAFPFERQKSAEIVYNKEFSREKISIQDMHKHKSIDGNDTCLKVTCNLF